MESREELALKIKMEIDSITNEQTDYDTGTENIKVEATDNIQNPFANVQLQIKQELLETAISNLQTQVPKSNSDVHSSVDQNTYKSNEQEIPSDSNAGLNIKKEVQNEGDDEYSRFDDSGSINSEEAAALGNVEACLQEELNIKFENEGDEEPHKDDNIEIKLEPETTLQETNIPPNVKAELDSQTLPVGLIVPNEIPKNTVNEAIIPNGAADFNDSGLHDDYDEEMSFENNMDTKPNMEHFQVNTSASFDEMNEDLNTFQLNSITGNVLSLEQLQAIKEKPFKCPECPNTYFRKRSLTVHLGVHRVVEKRKRAVINGVMKRRKNPKPPRKYYEMVPDVQEPKTIKEGYNCTCGKVFQRRSRMETCLRSHDLFETSSSCVSCVTCSKSFRTKDELANHRKRLHRKKFPCKFCPTAYDSRKELFKHLQDHQKVQLMEYKVISEVVKGKQKLFCFMCSKTYTELSELKTHVMTDHKGPYSCPHCKNTFPKIIEFAKHMKAYHPEVEYQTVLDILETFSKLAQAWKCEECDLQFLEPDKLALHEAEAHNPQSTSEPQFQCTDCKRVFISQKGLTSHRRVHHSESFEEPKVVPDGIMCLECRKICKDINALTSHMRLHSPDRKYPCKFCDFRFATPEKRKAHAEIHTGDMKYVCFICEYQCSSENRLKKHKMSLKHANMREYLLTGKPLIEEPATEAKDVKKKEKSAKKKKTEEEDTSVYKSISDNNSGSESESDSTAESTVPCDVCGETFPTVAKMQEHKETHPFIEIPSSGNNPTRIFFK